MKSISRWALAIAFVSLPLIGTQAQSYESELKLGVAVYKEGRMETAIEHFRRAVEIDSEKTVARLYLATACANQYIPGVESDDNRSLADQAMEQYQFVLNSDADREARINSAKGIAYLNLNMKRLEDARTYYQKASSLDPKDPEPYYSIGTIDWTLAYQPRMEARSRLNLTPDQQLNSKNPDQEKVCAELSVRNRAVIEDGIENLEKAIQLRRDYDDAMAYMNLMYRERADLECDDPAAHAYDLKTADDWVDKTLAIKKKKAEIAASNPTEPSPQ